MTSGWRTLPNAIREIPDNVERMISQSVPSTGMYVSGSESLFCKRKSNDGLMAVIWGTYAQAPYSNAVYLFATDNAIG